MSYTCGQNAWNMFVEGVLFLVKWLSGVTSLKKTFSQVILPQVKSKRFYTKIDVSQKSYSACSCPTIVVKKLEKYLGRRVYTFNKVPSPWLEKKFWAVLLSGKWILRYRIKDASKSLVMIPQKVSYYIMPVLAEGVRTVSVCSFLLFWTNCWG